MTQKPSTRVPEKSYEDAHLDRVRRKAKSVLRTIPGSYAPDPEDDY